MTKKILICIACVSLLYSIFIAQTQFKQLYEYIVSHNSVVWILILAILIQLVGHILRAARTKLVTDQAALSSLRFQFGALATGYLFNALLPLRLGEIVRALLVSKRLKVSFLYTFTAIIIERAVDVIFLGVLIIVGIIIFGLHGLGQLFVIAVGAILVASALLIGIIFLVRQNKVILNAIWRSTAWFSQRINNSLRFKVWSLIFGLQQFINNKKLLGRYAFYTFLSWACYAISAFLIALTLFSHFSSPQSIISSIAPYVASVSSWSVFESQVYAPLAPLLSIDSSSLFVQYTLLLWVVLLMPMAILGIGFLFIYKVNAKKTIPQIVDKMSFVNKLSRKDDISQEFPAFLDSYFLGNRLAQVLHKLETTGDLRLVKFFKGGSDAITVLVLSNEDLYVKKIIPLEYQDRLEAQYRWLKKHQELKYLVKVVGEQKNDSFYAIDLDYDPDNIPLFEYIHHSSIAQSKRVLEQTWEQLYKHLYKNVKEPTYDPRRRDAFIEKHIVGCIEKAIVSNDDLREIVKRPTITINGEVYDNLYQIIEKIKKHPQAWRDIATYAHSQEVHGDMAIDNILVSSKSGRPVIIDPAPDGNVIEGPVFDMGKLSQSFYCGYEFLFRNSEPVPLNDDFSINYRDHRSAVYTKLWKYLRNELAPKYLSEGEQRSLLFHAAALHIRVLKHRVYINPDTVLQFYATGVRTLNDFLSQYESNGENKNNQ